MSLLIKNVEMPTDHPLWIVVHSDGTVEANEVSASRPVGWQTLRNAAIPVPPHGRLIDADELHSALRKRAKEFSNSEYGEGVKCGLADAREYIKIAHTIIPAEEGET